MTLPAAPRQTAAARIIVVGLGPIGAACARALDRRGDCVPVALVDKDPSRRAMAIDTRAAGAAESPGPPPPRVTDDLAEALEAGPDAAIVATGSSVEDVAPLLMKLFARGVHVVSSCEQLLWPWYRHPDLADRIDGAARRSGCAVLGTGVNPGFAMDALPVALSSMVERVDAVRCVRRLDAAARREPLQRKVGATMTVEQFAALKRDDRIGHRGLAESVALLGAGLGRRVEPGTVIESLEPVVARQRMACAVGAIEPGAVAGMRNTASWTGEDLRIELDLTMAVGVKDQADRVQIEGPTPLSLEIPGSLPGDTATVAALVNHACAIHRAAPGLRTMLDVPPCGCGCDPACH